MTRSIGHLLIHTVDIQRSTPVDNGHGGFDEVFKSIGIVAGRVSPASAKDLAVVGKEESRVTHAIYLAPKQDVTIGDKILFDSRTFHVRTPNIEPSIPIYKKVLAEEIQEA